MRIYSRKILLADAIRFTLSLCYAYLKLNLTLSSGKLNEMLMNVPDGLKFEYTDLDLIDMNTGFSDTFGKAFLKVFGWPLFRFGKIWPIFSLDMVRNQKFSHLL